MDQHSFFAGQDPDVAAFSMILIRIQIKNFVKIILGDEFAEVEKSKKDQLKVKNHGADPNLLKLFE